MVVGQQTPTHSPAESFSAVVSAACPADCTAADIVVLDSRKPVSALLTFSTAVGCIAARVDTVDNVPGTRQGALLMW